MKTKTENVMQLQPTGETYTVDLYEFCELSDDVRARLASEYLEENAQEIEWAFTDSCEHDTWGAVKELENAITGARVSWHYNRWYSCDFDVNYSYDDCYSPAEVETVDDNGYWSSYDICGAWNAHVRRLNAICSMLDYLGYVDAEVYPVWDNHYNTIKENGAFNSRADDMHGKLVDEWYCELERACDDVARAIESCLRSEYEYMHSEEYAEAQLSEIEAGYECRTCEYPYYKNGGYTGRVYYSDSRKWYTADGELYEEANTNHECVSIVCAS